MSEMKIKRINANNLVFFKDFIIDNDLTIIIETRKNPYGIKYLLAHIEGSNIITQYTPGLLGESLEKQEKRILNLLRDKISGKSVNGIKVPTLRKNVCP